MEKIQAKKPRAKGLAELVPYARVSINYGDLVLGTLYFDFHFNKKVSNKTLKGMKYRGVAVRDLYGELYTVGPSAKRDIELSIKFAESIEDKLYSFLTLLYAFYPGFDPKESFVPTFLMLNPDMIFSFIKKEGIAALRLTLIRAVFDVWLSSPSANQQISRLGTALLEHSYGPTFKDKLFRGGRRPIELLSGSGTDWIKTFHRDLTAILRFIKKRGVLNEGGTTQDIIIRGFKQYASYLKDGLQEKGEDELGHRRLGRLLEGLEMLGRPGYSNPISSCIEADPFLKDEFVRGKWEPNKFAKEIIARQLNVSIGTIDAALYRIRKGH